MFTFRLALGHACTLERGAFAGARPEKTKTEMVLCLYKGTLHVRVEAFSPPSLCHFATQGLLPTVAVLGSASPCPCVALW